jgi:hypothetical protein
MRTVHVHEVGVDLKLLTALLQRSLRDIDAKRLLENADVPHVLWEGVYHFQVEVGFPAIKVQKQYFGRVYTLFEGECEWDGQRMDDFA